MWDVCCQNSEGRLKFALLILVSPLLCSLVLVFLSFLCSAFFGYLVFLCVLLCFFFFFIFFIPLVCGISLAFIGRENALTVRLISPRITILGMRISTTRSSMFEENRAPTVLSLQNCWRQPIFALEKNRVGEKKWGH